MQTGKRGGLMSEINVTPMVDVMLVLLIIFMVSAPMMKEGLNVNLPKVDAKALPSEELDVTVSINKSKQIDVNGSSVEADRLEAILTQIKEQRGIQNVYLQADEGVPYGYVAEVMGRIRATGLTRIGLVTEPPANKG